MPVRGDSRNDQDASARVTLSVSNLLMLLMAVVLALGIYLTNKNHKPLRSSSFSVQLTEIDVRGQRVTLPAPPERIVSLSPAETEILFALGLKTRIVADSAWCTWPPEAKLLPHIGDMTTSVEMVAAQRPDLVVGSSSANLPAIRQIEKAGIPCFAVDPNSLEEVKSAILSLGKITATSDHARQIVQEMDRKIEQARKLIPSYHPRVLMILQTDPLWVVGSGTFLDEIITQAGGNNITHSQGKGFVGCAPEKIVALKPDIILTAPQYAAKVKAIQGWSDLPAVRNGAVYTPEQDPLMRPGPRLADAFVNMVKLLHQQPEAGRK